MKRYTLVFRPSNTKISLDELKDEVEQLLLRLHPRIIYKMRQVFLGKDGRLVAEIAVDGKRELLEDALKCKIWSLPVSFESLSWGWWIENEDTALLSTATSPFDTDPLAAENHAEENVEYPLSKKRLWMRYIFLIVSTLVMVFLLLANALHNDSPVLEGIYIISFFVWLLLLNGTPFDIRVYADNIRLLEEGFEVKYWFRRQPIKIKWVDICGLEFSDPICKVLLDDRKIGFLISERFGFKEQKRVLKAIVEKAKLNYVEGNFQKLIYRKFDSR